MREHALLATAGGFLDQTRARSLGAALAGALWGLCFERFGLGTIAGPWALVPLFLLLTRPDQSRGWRGRFSLGWIHGTVAWCVAIPWIASTVHTYGDLPWAVGLGALVILALYLGAYHAVFAACLAVLWPRSRGGAGSALLAVAGCASLWLGLEWLRAWLLSGFPWNLAAHVVVGLPGALSASSWVGALGVSWLLVASNAGLALAWRQRRWVPLLAPTGAAAFLLAAQHLVPTDGTAASKRAPIAYRIVQPNTGILAYDDSVGIRRAFDRLLELSVCDRPGTLIVWPESASWPYSWQYDPVVRRAVGSLTQRGCSVLFNTTMWQGEVPYNSALLIDPDTPLDEDGLPTRELLLGGGRRYDKLHLVPFGEYVPLGDVLPFVRQIARAAGTFRPGRRVPPLPFKPTRVGGGERSSPERLGLAICFEITDFFLVARTVSDGATVLVTTTNDAWYGDSSAPWQHLTAARFRAAENRRPLLRAALSGISAAVGTRGQLLATLGVGQQGTVDGSLVGVGERTFYNRAPWLMPSLSCLLCALCLARAMQARRWRAGEGHCGMQPRDATK